jgi:hypothetical protein
MVQLRFLRQLLLAFAVALIPAAMARAEVVISVNFGPPPLLVYDQPPCPDQGMIWTPGYWAYGPDGYFWVPGAWVPAPFEGALWTPGYWGWSGGMYYWHPGYWGYHVGYYGGINYGFGYFGIGFLGGRWNGGFFEYNTAVWHVDRDRIHRFYDDHDWNGHYVDRNSRVAFSGGPGGIRHDPDRNERAYMNEQHFQRTSFQTRHIEAARQDHNAYYNVNHGRPGTIVASRPLGRENRPAPVQRNGFTNNPRGGAAGAGNGEPRNGYQPNRGAQPTQRNSHDQQVPRGQPQYRPQPEYRTVPPQMQQHQQENQRPQQPQYRTQPEYRPQPQPRTQPQSRPQPESRPQQQPRPENRGNGGERPQDQHGGDHGHGM